MEIALKQVTVIKDRHTILDRFSARFPTEAVSALVGDEKSGKLTALKVIAGIEKIDAGDVIIDERSMLETPAGERAVAMVHGADSLMPNKSAADNIGFPLRLAGLEKALVAARVDEAARRFGLADNLKKKPRKLSPGERLRVCYARAFARKPSAYLVSEGEVGDEARGIARDCLPILRAEGASVILATTTLGELSQSADWFCFIEQGRAIQRGARQAVMARPRTLAIAKQLGHQLIEGTITNASSGAVTVRTAGGSETEIPLDNARDFIGERITLALPQSGELSNDLAEAMLFDEAGAALAPPVA